MQDDRFRVSTEPLPPKDGAGLPAQLRWIVLSGPDRGKSVLVDRGVHRVGKDETCALVLTDPAVSWRHLEIHFAADGVSVVDLDSKNGSYFQGGQFSQISVGVGAVIQIGATELKLASAVAPEPMPPSTADRFGDLIGDSLVMRQLFAILERVAESEASVLIEGETGTGKELCAEALHRHSPRAKGPFVVCDLAGVSRSLIESELFGHRRGAFTGADRDRTGAFVHANGGTIFIDELGELEAEMQPRLLRALAQHQVKPVGDSRYLPTDVRVIAATHRDLREECKARRFREDLYHRLAVVRVELPPLRARKEDIPRLVKTFIAGAGREISVPPETLALLVEYDWPGNVRELKNTIERALSLRHDEATLSPELLGLTSTAPPPTASLPEVQVDTRERFRQAKEALIAKWERTYLTELLRRVDGNVSRAARECGLERSYLHALLRKHAIGDAEPG